MIEANGGAKNWESLQSISVTFTFSGPTLTRKGYPGHHEAQIVIDTKSQKVEFKKFGNIYGTYTPAKTEVGTLGSAAPLDVRYNPRDAFKDHTPTTEWDHHDLIYFVGYAFWYYFSLPFCLLLPGVEVSETTQVECLNGETWRGLTVTFPEAMHTHTKVQGLYFDQKYRLRRMDYHVDIIGPRPVSHYCYDHKTFEGITWPTFRFVNHNSPGLENITGFVIQVSGISVSKAAEGVEV